MLSAIGAGIGAAASSVPELLSKVFSFPMTWSLTRLNSSVTLSRVLSNVPASTSTSLLLFSSTSAVSFPSSVEEVS